jgi:hypothetical protein
MIDIDPQSNIGRLILSRGHRSPTSSQPELSAVRKNLRRNWPVSRVFQKSRSSFESEEIDRGRSRTFETADKARQISECLKALLLIAVYDDSEPTTVLLTIKVQRALFIAMYGGGWQKEQRQHFDFVADRLGSWHAYFLSYTNAGSTVLNDDYTDIINKYADPQVRKTRNPDEDNMLADAVTNWFDRNKVGRRRSFYDKKKIEAGDFLKEAIAPAVRNALAFVQLVHLDTFTAKSKVNWSYEEYELFNEYNEEQLKEAMVLTLGAKDRELYKLAFESRLIAVIAGDPTKLKLPNE